MSVTVKELKKNYNLNEEQMKKIRDAMDAAQRAIEADIPGRRSHLSISLQTLWARSKATIMWVKNLQKHTLMSESG